MLVVDSSAWIEVLRATPTGLTFRGHIPTRDQWIVPTIIQLELAKWAYRVLDRNRADEIIAYSQKCVVVPLDSDTAVSAAAICAQHKLATADAIVYATALAHGAELLTCDAHFEHLPNVRYVKKQP